MERLGRPAAANEVTYVSRLKRWKKAGYRIEIIYLTLPSPGIALRRIASRVQQGGHGIPKADAKEPGKLQADLSTDC